MFTLGCDPEFMLEDEEGQLRSAIGLLGGTKDSPEDLGGGHMCLPDNVLAECCPRYADSLDGFLDSLRDCLGRLAARVRPYRLRLGAYADYPPEELQTDASRTFGCVPDLDIHELDLRLSPELADGFTGRSAGGHVHVGFDFTDDDDRLWAVRALELLLGTACTWLSPDPYERARKALYGGAGAWRAKEYGVEYRTPSNFWLAHPDYAKLVWLAAHSAAVAATHQRDTLSRLWDQLSHAARGAINHHDPKEAANLFRRAYNALVCPHQLLDAANALDRRRPKDGFYKAWGIRTYVEVPALA